MKRSLSATTALVASLSLLATNPVVAQTATDGSTTTQTDTTVTTTDATTGSAVATDGTTPCDPALTDQSATDNATDGLSNIDTAVSAVTNLLGGGDNADTSATTTAEGDATAAMPCDDGSGTTASASGDASSDAATTTAPDTATAAGDADGAAAGDASANTAATTTGGADSTATAQDGSATASGSGEAQSDGSVTVTSEGSTAAPGDAAAAQSTAAQSGATAADDTATAQTTAQTGADANAQQNASGEAIPLEELTNTGDGDTAAAMSGEGASVAAAAEGEAGTAQVETEQVTEARSSMEDFDTKVNLEPDAQAQANAQASGGNDDDGLSKLEKGLLVGAGALAVGALLRNNAQVVANSGDRVVVRRNNDLQVLKDDNALLRTPGAEVETQTFSDGSSRQIVTRSDGSKIITVRDENLRVIQRTKVFPDGDRTVLFDDTVDVEPVEVSQLPRASTRSEISVTPDSDVDSLRQALNADLGVDRRFSLRQIRDISEVRALAPALELEAVTFPTGSAAIQPSQAQELAALGSTIKEMIDRNPREVFLVEGHTDAVGSAAYNLALSDRRAETVALALTEYFDVPPENLVVQGYGEAFLKVPTQQAERENRRATVRRITPLLRTAAAN